jgi:quinol monooxygenase YgiN
MGGFFLSYDGEMKMGRRELMAGVAGLALSGTAKPQETQEKYGLIGKMLAAPGQRDAVIAILVEGVAEMPGCLSYVVAKDSTDANALWITEVWDNKASHDASLSLPAVKNAITKGRPLITGFGERFVTTPVGGYGLR